MKLNRNLGGHHGQSGRALYRQKYLALSRPARSAVTILTELYGRKISLSDSLTVY